VAGDQRHVRPVGHGAGDRVVGRRRHGGVDVQVDAQRGEAVREPRQLRRVPVREDDEGRLAHRM
jgi:hypothetical protein